MNLISLLVVLIIIGVLIWAVTTYIPMDAGIKNVIRIVGVLVAVLYVLHAFGILGAAGNVTVPHLR